MHVSQASGVNGATMGGFGTMVATAAAPAHGLGGPAGQGAAGGGVGSQAIVFGRRDPGGAAVAGAEPRLLLLAAGDLQAAGNWARGLLGEGVVVDCHAIADSPLVQPGCERTPDACDPAPRAQAVALHVAEALAPHLAQLRTLRSMCPQWPLLVVVRGLRDLDQVLALEMGADDVLDVAVGAPVVAARLRALWRRAAIALAANGGGPSEPPRELRFGALLLRRLEREVRLADAPVPLTEGEFEVLWLLASHAGQALSRREILKRVRGLDDQPLDRSIDSRVYRIRAKLGDGHAATARIRTVRHQGYVFSPSGW